METHFAVGRLTHSYVKAALQSTIYNNTHLEKCLTLCQVVLGLRKKKKKMGEDTFFHWVFFSSLPPPLWNFSCASAVSCSMVLDRCLHTQFQSLPSIPFLCSALHRSHIFYLQKQHELQMEQHLIFLQKSVLNTYAHTLEACGLS